MPLSIKVQNIKATALDVDDNGRVLLKLSDVPSEVWQDQWERYWQNPTTWSSAFRRSVYNSFNGSDIVFETEVDDFVKHHKAVAEAGIAAANERVVRLEAQQRECEMAAAEEEQRHREAVGSEREKARSIRFDSGNK